MENIVLQVGVKALLKNKEGKYLLLLRSAKKYQDGSGDLWDIPGGRIDAGSTLLENLKREIMEETSLVLEDKPRLIAAQDILIIEGSHVVRLTYVASLDGEPKIDGDEHTDHKWFTKEEILALPNLDLYIREVLEDESTEV